MPEVVTRVGVDPSPLDLSIEDDRRWLQACYWPEEPRRMARLDAALATRPSWPATTILKGTARERLGDALALCDPRALTIVVNSYALGYFSELDQLAFFEEMTRAMRDVERGVDFARVTVHGALDDVGHDERRRAKWRNSDTRDVAGRGADAMGMVSTPRPVDEPGRRRRRLVDGEVTAALRGER